MEIFLLYMRCNDCMKATFTLWGGEVMKVLPFEGLRCVLYISISAGGYFDWKRRYHHIIQSEQTCSFSSQSKAKTIEDGIFISSPDRSTAAFVVIGQMWLARF